MQHAFTVVVSLERITSPTSDARVRVFATRMHRFPIENLRHERSTKGASRFFSASWKIYLISTVRVQCCLDVPAALA
jgi:hypothetical protein